MVLTASRPRGLRAGRRSAAAAVAVAVVIAVAAEIGTGGSGWTFAGLVGPTNRGPTSPAQKSSLADHSKEADGLFNNIRGVAAFLAGGVLPLGFFASPKADKEDTPRLAWQKRVHHLIATGTSSCLLTAIVYATIAVNKLAETPSRPTADVVQLLAEDYELAWVGCNVNLLLGLMGFALMLVSYALIAFGPIGQVSACMVSSSLCLMIACVNEGIARGDGTESGRMFSSNLGGLVLRYVVLLAQGAARSRSPLLLTSFVLAAAALARLVQIAVRRDATQ